VLAAASRAWLGERLQIRRGEIERAILLRTHSISDPTEIGDPGYVEGLRAAVFAGLGYGLAGIEDSRARPSPIPAELFAQARRAARNGVSLATVLRRYFAGYTLLSDFVMREAEDAHFLGLEELQHLMKMHAARFDRLLEAIAAEYESEAAGRTFSRERRRADCVDRLLAGELTDTSELVYDLDVWHVGAISAGLGAEEALRALAAAFDRRLLLIRRSESASWAWLGGSRPFDSEEIDRIAGFEPPSQVSLALGEPARGLDGWRFTHRQARAALPIAQRSPRPLTRYADVALLASTLQDEVLRTSLKDFYLAPMESERDGGETLRQTLRAYCAADRNVSSTAAALRVDRKTVTNRLRVIEDLFGRPLSTCITEVEVALRLEMGDIS
jgi:hypothetical protein